MYRQSKDKAYHRIGELEDFFFWQMKNGNMSKHEYNWVVDLIKNIISSIANFDNIEQEDYYYESNRKEELEE